MYTSYVSGVLRLEHKVEDYLINTHTHTLCKEELSVQG